MAKKSKVHHQDSNYTKDISNEPQLRKKFHLKDLKQIQPKTKNQSKLFDSWYDDPQQNFFLCGSAGTGKTFLSMFLALYDVLDSETDYDQVVIVRSPIQSGRDMGALPGDVDEKMLQYESPYIAICDELFPWAKSYENLKKLGKINFIPTSFIRGTTFNNSIIILDEIQNCTFEELATVITRVGKDSKIVFCGDIKQNDLNKSKYEVSGFNKFYEIIVNMADTFDMIEFEHSDIVRSKLVKEFIITCEKMGF